MSLECDPTPKRSNLIQPLKGLDVEHFLSCQRPIVTPMRVNLERRGNTGSQQLKISKAVQ